MAIRTIEVNDSLSELVKGSIEEVKTWFEHEINNKDISKEDYETIESLIDALNYNGDLQQIVDNMVPIYTHELDTLFYLHKHKLNEAFENSGIGNKSDFEDSPLGFEGIAIYCYIEQEVNEWFNSSGWFNNPYRPKNDDGTFQELGFEEWFSGKYWSIE